MASTRPAASRKLPRGPSALDPATARELQRTRLQAAMVTVVARNGYAETRVADIAAEAQVSRNAFYALFADREACFMATWEATLAQAVEQVLQLMSARPGVPRSVQESLQGVMRGLAAAVIARPDHARLLLVDALAVGANGPALRRQVVRRVEQWIGEAVSRTDGPTTISPSCRTVIACGVLQVIDQHLQSGRVRQLRGLADDLATWAVSYETSSPLPAHRTLSEPPAPAPPRRSLPLPRGHQKLPRSFVDRYQRERVLQAVIDLAADGGYTGVTVPEVVAAARISNNTFYDHFADKHSAFLAAYDETFASLFAASWAAAAGQTEWTGAVRDGITAWVDHLAADPGRARFGFIDVLTSGRDAAAKMDESYQAFAHLLSHGYDSLPPGKSVPPIATYAISAGIAGLVTEWIVSGRTHELHELAPDLCYAALAPFLGDPDARSTAEQLKAA
jgi:AcrR family transcriptional regulator